MVLPCKTAFLWHNHLVNDFFECGDKMDHLDQGRLKGETPDYSHEYLYKIPHKRRPEPEKERKDAICEVYEWVESGIFAIVCILLVFTFVARTVTVLGSSMVPTLHDNDRMILRQIGYHDPQYGDIIVIDQSYRGEPPIIKRVIGKAGDVIYIDFHTSEVWRNDTLLQEPYINELTKQAWDIAFPAQVPEGTVFVLGDNRNHSMDSRDSAVGMVDLRRVMGKAVFRFFPLGDVGGVE
jgi:signal peptidase I